MWHSQKKKTKKKQKKPVGSSLVFSFLWIFQNAFTFTPSSGVPTDLATSCLVTTCYFVTIFYLESKENKEGCGYMTWFSCHSALISKTVLGPSSQALSHLNSYQITLPFFFLLFFSFIFISWRLITLQYCSGFCHTLTWIRHGFSQKGKDTAFLKSLEFAQVFSKELTVPWKVDNCYSKRSGLWWSKYGKA